MNCQTAPFLSLIDGEQDIGVFDFFGTPCAVGNELGEFEAFFGGQGHFVNLFHGNFRVRGKQAVNAVRIPIQTIHGKSKAIVLELTGH